MRKGKGGSMLSAPQQQIILTVQDDALPSERRQKCRIRKQESGHVKQSEESITLMTSCRLSSPRV